MHLATVAAGTFAAEKRPALDTAFLPATRAACETRQRERVGEQLVGRAAHTALAIGAAGRTGSARGENLAAEGAGKRTKHAESPAHTHRQRQPGGHVDACGGATLLQRVHVTATRGEHSRRRQSGGAAARRSDSAAHAVATCLQPRARRRGRAPRAHAHERRGAEVFRAPSTGRTDGTQLARTAERRRAARHACWGCHHRPPAHAAPEGALRPSPSLAHAGHHYRDCDDDASGGCTLLGIYCPKPF